MFYANTAYEVEECCNCGIRFAMTAAFRKRCLENGDWFYCPRGHKQHYTEPTVPALEKSVEREQLRRMHAEDEIEALERSNIALRGVITRMKKKAG